jgi:hypothetical protein
MNMNKRLILTAIIGFGSTMLALAQAPYDQYLMSWAATGYTTNANGRVITITEGGKDFIDRVAADNGLNPADLVFVYRAEKRDMAVVYRSTGAFVADVYQMEYTFTDVTNPTDTGTYRQAFLNDEYHTNATGSTFGIETKTVNKEGNITSYLYHGTFQYAMPGPPTPLDPEVNTVWCGSFITGARIPYTLPITSLDLKQSHPNVQEARVTPKRHYGRRGGELLGIHRALDLPTHKINDPV